MPAAKFHKVEPLLAEGKSLGEIAQLLSTSEKAVRHYCRSNGIPFGRVTPVGWWTDERIEKAKALFADGLSASEIGARIDCSRNTVIGKLTRLGIMGQGTRGSEGESLRLSRLARALRKRREAGKRAAKAKITKTRRLEPVFEMAPPPPPPEQPPPGATSLIELAEHQCRHPYGEGPFLFCPYERLPNSSYCMSHHRLCYQPVLPPARRKEPVLQ